ncbi:uncharacterized protein LACBIDRAFT_303582 [Laccaria bicolor S238N-H82]|uniref:Predicted protein n=1 Tax=Laccaria bicolor (strain S238N-H82 / ATCC MYA-4686) TaxID=486041 RepID=B0DJS1_LACBS|nr:uncharacterized protein LACBIDRAFT_303582 [Laccaria bicolor S238N-H82]EDR05258.1 predicted protein [Laccaria bicolor S238N-H82]|eukprot:XP_001884223.1 predicted protein [Laccaria bicolor S238N-H82]
MLTDISLYLADRPLPPPLPAAQFTTLSTDYTDDFEKTLIVHAEDPEVYDSGNRLSVFYKRNKVEANTVENQILDCDDWQDKEDKVLKIFHDVFPTISVFCPTVTRITVVTVDGKLTTSLSEDTDEITIYLPIPPHLSHLPTVPIAELRKVEALHADVDLVKWQSEPFAFKKSVEDPEGTIQELTILDKLSNSPNIIDVTGIVVNQDKTIRGFLMPYIPAGNLRVLFERIRKDEGVAHDQLILDWSNKLRWALQIVQGVVDLHSIAAYNGDLKPENIVVAQDGQAILIDFLPMGISDMFAAPELLEKWDDHEIEFKSMLTPQADIYSLGLTLYALTQENGMVARPPVWREGSAPAWYQGVVQRCLEVDPSARPSATEVLSLLQKGSS